MTIPIQEVDIHSRRYLGNKTRLLDFIETSIREKTQNINSFVDIFAGTGAVAERFNRPETSVLANDLLPSNEVCLSAWLGSESVRKSVLLAGANELTRLPNTPHPSDSFVSAYGGKYFSVSQAETFWRWRDGLNEVVQAYKMNQRERDVLLAGILYTADRHALTFGHYEAFQKRPGSDRPLNFLLPRVASEECNKNNTILRVDANSVARFLKSDVVYLDPPYNSRQYGAAYHVLDVLATGVVPQVKGISRKPADRLAWKSSAYCLKSAPKSLRELVENIDARLIVMSYSNMEEKGDGRSNAKISGEEIMEILQSRGRVFCNSTQHKAFNTGKTNLDDHRELLYICKVR